MLCVTVVVLAELIAFKLWFFDVVTQRFAMEWEPLLCLLMDLIWVCRIALTINKNDQQKQGCSGVSVAHMLIIASADRSCLSCHICCICSSVLYSASNGNPSCTVKALNTVSMLGV